MTRTHLSSIRSLFILFTLILSGCSSATTPAPAAATQPPADTPTTAPTAVPSATPTTEPTAAPTFTATAVPPTATHALPTATQAAASPTPEESGGNRISISGFSFSPSQLQVKVGTRVTWTNRNSTSHTVSADDGSFSSGDLDLNDTYSRTFDEVGTFAYHCDFHPSMTGTIEVVP